MQAMAMTRIDEITTPAEKREATKQEIVRRMSAAIVEHRLPPGTKLPEENLAEFFSVSRARVRDALTMLNQERLVTIVPHRGAFVAEPTVDETREIYEVRRVIETAMVRSVAKGATTKDIADMRGLVAAEQSAWKENDSLGAIRYSREFHMSLARLAGNSILEDTLRNILSRGALSSALYGQRNNPGCLCEDHFDLIDTIEQGDADAAAMLMEHHLEQIERRLNLHDNPQEISLEDALRDTE